MSTSVSPDPIHYDPSKSYRDGPYRQMNHQNGCIGNFTVRLVEGKNLIRSHWSVLGIGPVKRLGLSKAHGEVSSYAEFRLGFQSREEEEALVEEGTDTIEDDVTSNDCSSYSSWGGMTRTFPNSSMTAAIASASANSSHDGINNSKHGVSTSSSTKSIISPPNFFPQGSKTYCSSTVSSNSNPKWPAVQSSITKSMLNIPLCKGTMPQDGMKVILEITMREEKTAADTLVSGIVRGRNGDGGDEALGWGCLDVTSLILRGYNDDDDGGGRGTPIEISSHGFTEWDIWVNIWPDRRGVDKKTKIIQKFHRSDKKEDVQLRKSGDDGATVGKVRLLVSYDSNGLKPQKGDIVALESFARRSPSLAKSRPILPPLNPLKVSDVKGEYLLVHFDAVQPCGSSKLQGNDLTHKTKPAKTCIRLGQVRIHRNEVFVIERIHLLDSAYNIALKPADIAMSTSIGRQVSDRAHPYVAVAGDLIMPAVASARFLLEAAKVGGSALKSATVAAAMNRPRGRRARRHSFPD